MIQRVLKILEQIENTAMAVLALVLIFAAAAQVVLRLFDVGVVWLDPVLRALVMWIAMLGALAATRHDKHINLDALTRLLSGWSLRAARLLTLLFAAAICVVLANASYGLVQLDRESMTPLVNDIPAWWVEVILPVGFGLMALRFALRAFVLPAPSQPEAT
ncbi:TRAP transporter small permease [Ahniella affigens]|uniref:TRAP transporter small permease protein n=1 Tax=Ahniella affigens TaxID=2021234 RepID=A0A2P1PV34_9GAMM|nr:TRAP transporter small permease subunit [Ahniella affigens]AVP98725.1 TRAP transporter small permease [Ahniella affigens]